MGRLIDLFFKAWRGEPRPHSAADVEIYTWRLCPYCIRARRLLRRKGVVVREYRIGGDETARRQMTKRAGGHSTLPQIFINGVHVGGCDELFALEYSGDLDVRLNESPRFSESSA
jgi:glutaredoxin 3